jgi:hypothetical protein
MPPFAAAVIDKDWRSRPGSSPPVFVSDVAVEGLDKLLRIAAENLAQRPTQP